MLGSPPSEQPQVFSLSLQAMWHKHNIKRAAEAAGGVAAGGVDGSGGSVSGSGSSGSSGSSGK